MAAKRHSEDSDFTQISFFNEESEEELSMNHKSIAQNYEEEEEEEIVVKPAKSMPHKQVKSEPIVIKKEQNSGFNLFGFMNSGKNKAENNVRQRAQIEEDEIELESSEQTKQKHKITNEKSQEAMKKKQEFFGGTVFDDKKESEENHKMDDDVINVPAFFRRKKGL